MEQIPASRSLRHFTRHIFLIGKIYTGRNRAKEEVYASIHRIRRSIIRMNLTYTDIDNLKKKIEKWMDMESRYARFFRPEDKEIAELKNQINYLQEELKREREDKAKVIWEHEEKVMELNDSLSNVKNSMKHLFMEKAKRQQRLNSLEKQINKKIDLGRYYSS